MKKVYANMLENHDYEGIVYRVIEVEEKDIIKEYSLANTLRIEKKKYKENKYNLKNYTVEEEASDFTLHKEELDDYHVIDLSDVNSKFIEFFQDLYWYSEIEQEVMDYNERYDLEEGDEDYLTVEIVKKFIDSIPKLAIDIESLYSEEVTYICNGHNHDRIVLDGVYEDFCDYTEEFGNLESVDFQRERTGHYELLKNEENTILCYVSYYQGDYVDTYYVVSEDIDNIERALEYIEQNRC